MDPRRITVLLAAVTLGASGCASPRPVATPTPPPSAVATATTATTTGPAATAAPAVRPVTAAELGATWRPGCPEPPEDLRRVELDFLGFDGRIERGVLVVHRDLVEDVIAIFDDLLRQRYPIQRMRTVENYPDAEDELSMRDNNTSAFNCRAIPGSGTWSLHAYGRAVDVNPLINPAKGSTSGLEPVTAGQYLDRTRDDPGMLRADSPAVRAFTDRGWRWGGAWRDPVDYQHFEKT